VAGRGATTRAHIWPGGGERRGTCGGVRCELREKGLRASHVFLLSPIYSVGHPYSHS
jgi:hypothetical protein